MITTGVLIAWTIVFATYLRYIRVLKERDLVREVIEDAKSPLQPYLAWYGLCWCIFICNCRLMKIFLILVTFEGAKAYARVNAFWAMDKTYWAFSLAPFAVLSGFVLILIGWTIHGGWNEWKLTPLAHVNLHGRTKTETREESRQSKWEKILNYF